MSCLSEPGSPAASNQAADPNMQPGLAVTPVELDRSWPLWEQPRHFELGHVFNSAITDAIPPAIRGELGIHHAGLWECDLADSSLIWSGGVYDMFGLQRGTAVSRRQSLAHYCEDSRAKLERLRAHAIRHRRGFTLDIEIYAAAVAERRRVRVIGAPVCDGDKVVRLHGLKLVV
jgi:PAS domain-containing protein